MNQLAMLSQARADFHTELVLDRTLVVDEKGIASNADSGQRFSREAALSIAQQLGADMGGVKLDGQRAGSQFETAVRNFVARTLPQFGALRPGKWVVQNVGGSRSGYQLAQFEPYRHLDELARQVKASPVLASVLGNSYDVSPDVIVVRLPGICQGG